MGSFPGPLLLLDCKDDGDDSITGVKDAKVMDITEFVDLEHVYWWLRDNPDEFNTVAIDTVTQLQQVLVEEVANEKGVKEGKSAGDWGTMTRKDWGEIAAKMKTWITNFRDLKMEVVFIAQDRVFNVDDEHSVDGMIDPEVGPRLSPSVMSHLCAAVSVIGHTFIRAKTKKVKVKGRVKEKEVKEYCLRLGPSASYITKLRKPKDIRVPDFLTNPTYEDILETIKGEE